MNEDLKKIAQALIAAKKGLLAADESTGTIKKRFEAVGLVPSPELNRKYRQMLFATQGIEEFISGIIMFDETVRQKTDEGIDFIEYLTKKGILPGIKGDKKPCDGKKKNKKFGAPPFKGETPF